MRVELAGHGTTSSQTVVCKQLAILWHSVSHFLENCREKEGDGDVNPIKTTVCMFRRSLEQPRNIAGTGAEQARNEARISNTHCAIGTGRVTLFLSYENFPRHREREHP